MVFSAKKTKEHIIMGGGGLVFLLGQYMAVCDRSEMTFQNRATYPHILIFRILLGEVSHSLWSVYYYCVATV